MQQSPCLFSSETWDAALNGLSLSVLVMFFVSLSDSFKYFHTADTFAALVHESIWSRHVIVQYNLFGLFAYSANFGCRTFGASLVYRVLKHPSDMPEIPGASEYILHMPAEHTPTDINPPHMSAAALIKTTSARPALTEPQTTNTQTEGFLSNTVSVLTQHYSTAVQHAQRVRANAKHSTISTLSHLR